MIVFYNRPNTLSLPYPTIQKVEFRDNQNKRVYDANGKVKLIDKIVPVYFKFIPGKNTISKELWLQIAEYNKEDWDHYRTILNVFRAKTIEIEQKASDDIGLSNTKSAEPLEVEIGENEEEIKLENLNTKEFRDLIENTMIIDDLKVYLKYETGRDKPRSFIIKAIKSRKARINKADEIMTKKGE